MSWDQSDDDDFDEDKNYFSGEDSDARRFMGNVTPTSSPGLNTSGLLVLELALGQFPLPWHCAQQNTVSSAASVG